MRHLPKLVLAWLASSVVSVPLSTNLLVSTQLLPRWRAQRLVEFKAHEEQIRADFALVELAPPFPEPTFTRNADVLFRAHVDFEREGQLASSPRAALAILDEKFPHWRSDEKDVRALLADALLGVVDTEWITTLASYDHWSPWRPVDLTGLTGFSRAAAFVALPRPDFGQVRDLALLHLLQSVKRGDTAGGVARIHHVAALAATTGTQDGHLTAASLLRLEGGFSPMPAREDVLDAFERLGTAWAQIVRVTQTQDVGFDPKPEKGACAAAADLALGLTPFADYLAPRAPFEVDLEKDLARERGLRRRLLETCGLNELKAFVDAPTAAGWWQESIRTPAGASPAMPNFAKVPYLRRVVGLYLLLQLK